MVSPALSSPSIAENRLSRYPLRMSLNCLTDSYVFGAVFFSSLVILVSFVVFIPLPLSSLYTTGNCSLALPRSL